MVIVISDAVLRKDEATIINALFDEGMQIFHLRKPSATASELQQLLQAINSKHHAKIALHQHHELAENFGINRLHYPEVKRKNASAAGWKQLKKVGFQLSTSIHNIDEVVHEVFDYVFFGPVFNSISKVGYAATINENTVLPKKQTKQIAIGGIDANNCAKALQMGFDGVAVLGAIWQSNTALHQFKQIQNACSFIAP
jgi:thiamine-phosphate pyrophosphorylase